MTTTRPETQTMALTTRFTYTKTAEDAYSVSHNGTTIGSIYRGWKRNGGSGWVPSIGLKQSGQSYRNREGAALTLYYWNKDEAK